MTLLRGVEVAALNALDRVALHLQGLEDDEWHTFTGLFDEEESEVNARVSSGAASSSSGGGSGGRGSGGGAGGEGGGGSGGGGGGGVNLRASSGAASSGGSGGGEVRSGQAVSRSGSCGSSGGGGRGSGAPRQSWATGPRVHFEPSEKGRRPSAPQLVGNILKLATSISTFRYVIQHISDGDSLSHLASCDAASMVYLTLALGALLLCTGSYSGDSAGARGTRASFEAGWILLFHA